MRRNVVGQRLPAISIIKIISFLLRVRASREKEGNTNTDTHKKTRKQTKQNMFVYVFFTAQFFG